MLTRTVGFAVLSWLLSVAVGHAQSAGDLIRPKAPIEYQAQPPSELWQVVERLATEQAIETEVTGVVEHLREMLGKRRLNGRRTRILDSLANPWQVPAHADALREDLGRPLSQRRPSFDGLVESVASWLDIGDLTTASSPEEAAALAKLDEIWLRIESRDTVEMDLMTALSEYLGEAHSLLARNLDRLNETDRTALRDLPGPAAQAWYRTHFPDLSEEESREHEETLRRFRVAVLQVDRAPVLRVARHLMQMMDPAKARDIAKRLERTKKSDRPKVPGFEGDIQAIVGDAPFNRVVLGGRRPATYSGEAALVIDLGGNDTYQRAAVAEESSGLASIVIDLRGRDTYSGDVGPVFTVGGVALLLDLDKDDTYTSKRHGQSASIVGFSLLADLEGDDHYLAEDYGQGYSHTGVALLYDASGDDDYRAWAYAQGAGIGNGLSSLIDGSGNDEYLADLHWPDVYGDSGPEIYHGASQGYSTGLRGAEPEIAGGFAALIDLGEGSDRYQSGSFSQGGGYYFGFGLMSDGGGDDENEGARYSQGFGVHQAVGVRWDQGGNDRYRTRSVAHCGSAWDEAVGFFIEESGNDVYEAGGLALGAAAQTAVAVLIEGGGNDHYQSAGGATQGSAGASEYHDKQSFALLLDLGGGRDSYSREDRGDDRAVMAKWNGIFLDTRAKSTAQLLGSKRPLSK